VIRLAGRLAISGGRESAARLVLTAIGVALGTALLLLAFAADPAIRVHEQRSGWQYTGKDDADLRGSGPGLVWLVHDDAVDGQDLERLDVAAEGPGAPVPLGLGHVPRPGEVFVSPALADLLDRLPADRLADRFPSGPSGIVPDRFLAGPDDLVAVVGRSPTELRDVPGAEVVHHVRDRAYPYGLSDFLRLVLALGGVALLVPVVVFVGMSTRLGAARREQRFAALRLAGATPWQTNVVAGVEAGAAAAVGAVAGAGIFAAVRPWAARLQLNGHRSFVSDLHVPPGLLAAVLVGVPALAVGAAMLSLRRLQVSPLGVARRVPRAHPTVRRLLPVVAGAAGFVFCLVFSQNQHGTPVWVQYGAVATFALMIYGIVVAGPWLTLLAARVVKRGGRASALLAGRRLEADPAGGFRAVSGLVLAVFSASVLSGVLPAALVDAGTSASFGPGPHALVASFPAGTTAATGAEVVDAVRGIPGIGDTAVVYADPQARLHDGDPARGEPALAPCADVAVLRVIGRCPAGVAVARVFVRELFVTSKSIGYRDDALPTPYTPEDLRRLPVLGVVAQTDGDPLATDLARTRIQRLVPASDTWLGSEIVARDNVRVDELGRAGDLALAISLFIAGCSLAVAVAGGIVERKRPFALLRLAGMRIGELRQVALAEAVAPLLLIASASAALGLAASAAIVDIAGHADWALPSVGYWASLVAGIVLAIGVAAVTLPLLDRATAPSVVRFE
jgi:hypothetical protein